MRLLRADPEAKELPSHLRLVYVAHDGTHTHGDWVNGGSLSKVLTTTIPIGISVVGLEDAHALLWMFCVRGRTRPFIWLHPVLMAEWCSNVHDPILALDIQLRYDLVSQYLQVVKKPADLVGEVNVLTESEMQRLMEVLLCPTT